MDLAIEVRDLNKSFKSFSKKVTALDNITLTVKAGEVFGFLGPNGAGKTTFIKILMGILTPDSGTVSVMGTNPFDREGRRRLGYLPERPYFHDFLTAGEFLQFHGRLSNLKEDTMKFRVSEVLDLVGLTNAKNLELKRYSKGMLQRIGLAQALLHDPDVLILDEPMSGLDPAGRCEVRDLIQNIARLGKTVFFSTHIVHDVEVLCTSFGFISKGQLKSKEHLNQALRGRAPQVEFRFLMEPHLLKENTLLRGATKALEGWVLNVKAENMNEVLSQVIHIGGQVLSVVPKKSGLESLFFEESTR